MPRRPNGHQRKRNATAAQKELYVQQKNMERQQTMMGKVMEAKIKMIEKFFEKDI